MTHILVYFIGSPKFTSEYYKLPDKPFILCTGHKKKTCQLDLEIGTVTRWIIKKDIRKPNLYHCFYLRLRLVTSVNTAGQSKGYCATRWGSDEYNKHCCVKFCHIFILGKYFTLI